MIHIIFIASYFLIYLIRYAIKFIRIAPNNLSPWNYIRGLMKNNKYSDYPTIISFGTEAIEKYPYCLNPLILMTDVCIEENTKESLDRAVEYCEKLITRDVMHAKFWEYKKNYILKKQQA